MIELNDKYAKYIAIFINNDDNNDIITINDDLKTKNDDFCVDLTDPKTGYELIPKKSKKDMIYDKINEFIDIKLKHKLWEVKKTTNINNNASILRSLKEDHKFNDKIVETTRKILTPLLSGSKSINCTHDDLRLVYIGLNQRKNKETVLRKKANKILTTLPDTVQMLSYYLDLKDEFNKRKHDTHNTIINLKIACNRMSNKHVPTNWILDKFMDKINRSIISINEWQNHIETQLMSISEDTRIYELKKENTKYESYETAYCINYLHNEQNMQNTDNNNKISNLSYDYANKPSKNQFRSRNNTRGRCRGKFIRNYNNQVQQTQQTTGYPYNMQNNIHNNMHNNNMQTIPYNIYHSGTPDNYHDNYQ